MVFRSIKKELSIYFLTANTIVPQVSAISSTKTATLFRTSPTSTILATSFAFFLFKKKNTMNRHKLFFQKKKSKDQSASDKF